ncbi:MAG: bile acid:sodium symporter family protein [Acidimicrobiia bacterium]
MTETLATIANLAILTFVLASMVSMGLSLTTTQVLEPLKNLGLVAQALIANFVLAPLAAWGIAELVGLSDSTALGLILIGSAAGAPFLPKLAQMAKGDVAYSVGLMTLLMVVTVAFIPLVLGTLIDSVEVGAWEIAKPLLLGMLLPLGLALMVRARYDDAKNVAPALNQISTMALMLGGVIALVLVLPTMIDSFGTGAYIALILFLAATLAAGYLLGGKDRATRVVSGLGTAQRNLSAALLIATTSFASDGEVFVMVMLASVVMLVVLLPLAAELGRRAGKESGGHL